MHTKRNIFMLIGTGIIAISGVIMAWCYHEHKKKEEDIHYRKMDNVFTRITK